VVSARVYPFFFSPTGSLGAWIAPEFPASLLEAKGPFVPLHQSVIGCKPPLGARELHNFLGNSRLSNSLLAKGNSPKKEEAVSH
jgi:hypothetical protein